MSARPRRIVADLEPMERKERRIMVGDRSAEVRLPIESRYAISVRPAARVAYEAHTYDLVLRDALAAVVERASRFGALIVKRTQRARAFVLSAFAALDEVLFDPHDTRVLCGEIVCLTVIAVAIAYLLAQIVRAA